ncbi:hypothetical protein A7C99_5458 [Trichophyton rubrum]|uniref:Uncharacterized protein n=1 Tax=Trichophyton rubrum TaxID=5551 RepID=A0A178ESN8_TRIRU|nr:hypothetical protein A7C99_5458 [Trichophyton rubrum]
MSASLAPECNEIKEPGTKERTHVEKSNEKEEAERAQANAGGLVEFLRGNTSTNECEEVFQQYKKCLFRTLKEKGIDVMLDEARSSNREQDADFLSKKSK